MVSLFGWEFTKKDQEKEQPTSFVEPNNEDATHIVGAGGSYGTLLDLEGSAKTEAELITKYREMINQPEIERAVEDIVNESIVVSDDDKVVELVTDDIDYPESIKIKLRDEFDTILSLLNFNNNGYDIYQKWYVDGRIYYHVIIDPDETSSGIKELRYIDPRKIKKIREVEKKRDERGFILSEIKNEYFIFNEKGFDSKMQSVHTVGENSTQGLKIASDSIAHCTSGLTNETNTLTLSHLHKAIRTLNQLRMLENASVIYRLARAPERRVFYIDTGNLPKQKAEQYLRDMMVRHKNKLVYDSATGEVKDDRKFMTMLEDFWLPRREGGKGTEIDTLGGGQNLGEMEDIEYFQKKLFQSLKVPISRLESDSIFNMGRASEITRDEIKFSRFISRLRNKFSNLFDSLLEKQLLLKGIVTEEEWPEIQNKLRYNFMKDNYFEELKQAEILQNRLNVMNDVDEHVGRYYSVDWVRKNVLMQTEDDIREIDTQIKKEKKAGIIESDEEFDDEEENEPDPSRQVRSPESNPQDAAEKIEKAASEDRNETKEQ